MNEFLKSFFSISGRLNRKPYILRVIFLIAVANIFSFIAPLVFQFIPNPLSILTPLSLILGLTIFIASICIEIRRLHDLDLSVWWLFASYVSFFGVAISPYLLIIPMLLTFMLTIYTIFCRGTIGPNPFGEDPLEKTEVPNTGQTNK